jgi:cell division protein FtsA
VPVKAGQADKPKKKNNIIKLEEKQEEAGSAKTTYNPDDLIFALDIGTRTVVGIVGVQEKNRLKVLSAEILEHKSRAMLDGQIHDINQVAEIAGEVKEKLEKKLGVGLTKVAIAAAGRVLKTSEAKVEKELDQSREIDQEFVLGLELEGVQQAQLKLDHEVLKEDKTQFYCVGYSVTNYYLNGYIISSLVGHKGKRIGLEVLATFLPHVVIDSLYTVMNKIGLEVVSLTLEPIAAINVTIPRDLRLLNLALVDVGAGTSDIAITRDGSVVAYAMVPIAGDEITESIIRSFLVDFPTAEKIKASLSGRNENISFGDILGRQHNIGKAEVMDAIKPTVELLAQTVSEKILEYNHKAPNAVFLIGGGSQISGLTDMVAKYLGLPGDRVVVRDRNVVQNVVFRSKKLTGPEAVTPLGIAFTAWMQKGQDFMSITFNGKKIRLFNTKRLTVADALILIGFDPEKLIGRTGKSVSFQWNGTKKTIRGEYGRPAEIFVNDSVASLETVLNTGDSIRVNPAENGRDAQVVVSDLISAEKKMRITLNGNVVEIGAKVFVNGKIAGPDDSISDGDIVQTVESATLKDLIMLSEINPEKFDITVNGQTVEMDYSLQNYDIVECKKRPAAPGETEAGSEEPSTAHNSDSGQAKKDGDALNLSAFKETGAIEVVVNGKPVKMNGNKPDYIFVDIFSFIDFDLSKSHGTIVLKLNGKKAGFTDPLGPGDRIDIYWE